MIEWGCEHCFQRIVRSSAYNRGCTHYPIPLIGQLETRAPATALSWPLPPVIARTIPAETPLRQVLKKQATLL